MPLFLGQFFRATIFLRRFFFNSLIPFWVDFTNICIFLLYIMCISSKSQTMFLTQNFCDVQLISNFLRYPAWL